MDNSQVGIKEVVVWSSVCILMGVSLANSAVDVNVLFRPPLTDKVVDLAESFYFMWWDAPQVTKLVLHAVIAALVLSLCVKFAAWSDNAFYFDGGSIVLVIMAIAAYGTVALPNIKLLYESSYLARNETMPPPENTIINTIKYYLLKSSRDGQNATITEPLSEIERKETVSVLCAGNFLALLFLAGVLVFQAADYYTKQQFKIEMEKIRKEEEEELKKKKTK
ncbi:hypothetical protein BT69DRAFT_1318270, partial [Atractiella rhizophila]